MFCSTPVGGSYISILCIVRLCDCSLVRWLAHCERRHLWQACRCEVCDFNGRLSKNDVHWTSTFCALLSVGKTEHGLSPRIAWNVLRTLPFNDDGGTVFWWVLNFLQTQKFSLKSFCWKVRTRLLSWPTWWASSEGEHFDETFESYEFRFIFESHDNRAIRV